MRLDQLSQNERNAIRNEYGKDTLFKTMNALCRNLQPEMKSIDLLFEDIFVMTCSIMDDIKENPEDFYNYHLFTIWEEIAGELRLLPKATDNEIAIDNAISTMLYMVCLFLTQWQHPDRGKYQIVIFEHLGKHRAISDGVRMEIDIQLYNLKARVKTSSLPNYLESEEYVALDVQDLLVNVEEKERSDNPDPPDESTRMTNAQLVLLFIEYLGLDLEECNINAFAKLLAAVSGRSQAGLYKKINEHQKKWKVKADVNPFKQDAIILRSLLSVIHSKFRESFDIFIEE